ncbi:unnamed protein product [Orchesella dallaii]|uniref:Peptidase metallopeptidase domain-containing protein n=1 Tax=Orchesella dallaii TaxID=48710 RepID=A0ABP1PTW0_9HEXA
MFCISGSSCPHCGASNSQQKKTRNCSITSSTNFFVILISTLHLVSWIGAGNAAPVHTDTGAMMYLSNFGWLDPSSKKIGSQSLIDIRKSIQDFQAFAGLNITGELDDETVETMSLPRCGVRDKIGHDARRRKRYALQGSRWKVKNLTYKISKYPRLVEVLGRDRIDAEIDEAFAVWQGATDLTFTRKSTGKVHIEIRFENREHGDGDPFDGEGGTLAHAYFPVYGGDAHFDDDEKWTIKTYRGTNLFQVAAHEFGHSLGLSHSDVRDSLMAPFYRGYNPKFKLHSDDLTAIQSLYGKKTTPPPPTPRTPSPARPPKFPITPAATAPGSGKQNSKLCDDPKIDAITTMSDGNTYAFKGSDVYRLTDNGIYLGYPKKTFLVFPGLPNDIDGAFTWSNDKTYFFKGSHYYRFTNMTMDNGYPKSISDGFSGIPANIDTAFVWGGNGKIYFFKGDQYWRFDPARTPPVSFGYPKPISNWNDIPNNLDAALKYSNGYTYFFKGTKYWRFNDRSFSIDTADPPFPRSVGSWWYGCGKSNTMKNGSPSSNDYNDPDVGEFDDKNGEGQARDNKGLGNDTQDSKDSDTNSGKSWWKKAWSWTKNVFG